MNRIKTKLWNVLSFGLPFDYDIEDLRKVVLFSCMIFLGSFFLILSGTFAFFQQSTNLMIVDYALVVFLLSLYFYIKFTLNYQITTIIGAIVFGGFLTYLNITGGLANTGHLWGMIYPVVALFLTGFKLGTILSLTFISITEFIFLGSMRYDFIASYNSNLMLRYTMVYFTIFIFAFIMERLRETVQHRLNFSKENLNTTIDALETSIAEKQMFINKLESSIKEIKELRGILPICSHCKKIRNDKGYWEQVECYIEEHSKAEFTHGFCPDCQKLLFPGI